MKNLKKLLLLLVLIVAGVQSVHADFRWFNKHADVVNVSIGGVTYEVCHIYWKVGEVNQDYMGTGYHERDIALEPDGSGSGYDYWLILYDRDYKSETNNAYYASVVGITGSGAITIPDSISNGGITYPVKYVGMHTEQTIVEKDTTYLQESLFGNVRKATTCIYYSYSKTPVSVTATAVTKLTVNANVEFKGNFSLSSCASVEFNKEVTFSSNVYFDNATSVVFNDYVTINEGAMLSCLKASTLMFNGLTHEGKIRGYYLTDIYYQNNLPGYSGSFSNYFTNVEGSQITAHVANKTQAECTTIHSSWAVYSDFAAVVPYTVTNPKYTVQVKIENARVQITYTKNGNTYTLTCESNRNITVDGSTNVVIRPYKTYDNLRLASVTLNGAEIIGNLTGSGTMYDAYTISDISSDVYLTFTGEEIVDVTVKVEASAPLDYFITNSFWVRPNYGMYDNLYANQSATFTMSKYGRFFFEMEEGEDETWGITWQVAAIYVNGKDMTADITYDMTTWFELESVNGDTEIRVVFEPNCDFVRVMSLDGDLLWTRFDGQQQLIDCAEGDNYYVPVIKNGEGVVVRTDLIGQSPADYEVIYWKNNGRYDIGQASMDQGGVELTPDGKNFQFKLLPGVKDQDRIIGIYPKAPAEPEGSLQKIVRHGGSSTIAYEYEYEWSAYPYPEVPVTESSPAEFILPPYNEDHGETYFTIWILLKDGESFKVYRNGDEVTDLFQKGAYNTTGKYTHYSINLGNTMRDAATWNFVIEPPTIDYTFIGDFNKVYATVDYGGEIDEPLDGWETAESEITVEGYYKGTIIENPMYKDADAAVLFNTVNDESFRVFRNGEEVTDQFAPVMSSGGRVAWIMHNKGALMHEPAQWVIITDSELSRYDVNRDKQISIADVTKLVNKILGKE